MVYRWNKKQKWKRNKLTSRVSYIITAQKPGGPEESTEAEVEAPAAAAAAA